MTVVEYLSVQGDSSKIGQTLRLKPCFNTVPLHFFFKLLCLSVVQVNYCTVDHSNLKKSWEGTVLKQGFNLNVCPILKESPCIVCDLPSFYYFFFEPLKFTVTDYFDLKVGFVLSFFSSI